MRHATGAPQPGDKARMLDDMDSAKWWRVEEAVAVQHTDWWVVLSHDGMILDGPEDLQHGGMGTVRVRWVEHRGIWLEVEGRSCQHDWQEYPGAEPPYDVCSACGAVRQ